jgi:type I restriction enzyme R subunit
LKSFDEFSDKKILSDRDIQDYHSIYIDLYNEFRKGKDDEKEDINDDLVFEMELIKQIEINIDYILQLIKQYHGSNIKDKDILVNINKAIESSVELRNKKDLIEQFIQSLEISSKVDEDWIKYVEEKKRSELEIIIKEEQLNPEKTYSFVENSFRDGAIPTTGTGITKILPPVSRFSPDGERTKKRKSVIERLISFFERFFDISKIEI